jgi:hypothetical protein
MTVSDLDEMRDYPTVLGERYDVPQFSTNDKTLTTPVAYEIAARHEIADPKNLTPRETDHKSRQDRQAPQDER